MNKILCILMLNVLLSLSVFADGETGQGNKHCNANCGGFANTTIEETIEENIDDVKTTDKATTGYFSDVFDFIDYYIEISF